MDDDEWNLREHDYNLWKAHKEDEDKGPTRPKRTRLKENTSPLNASKSANAAPKTAAKTTGQDKLHFHVEKAHGENKWALFIKTKGNDKAHICEYTAESHEHAQDLKGMFQDRLGTLLYPHEIDGTAVKHIPKDDLLAIRAGARLVRDGGELP